MKWRLYYGDGSIYQGESAAEAYNAPNISAILLKQETDNPRGYSIRHGCTFFTWENIQLSDGTILDACRWGGKNDLFGLMHYYETRKGPQKVLIGIEIHDETYHEINLKAAADGCLCDGDCNHLKPENY